MLLLYFLLISAPIVYLVYVKFYQLSTVSPKGKLVVITGAAQGIGKETVDRLLQLGAIVIACDINEEKLQQEFSEKTNVHPLRVDVTNVDDINVKLVDKVKELQMPVFGLVNNAGVAPMTTSALVYKSDEEINKVTSVNLLSAQRVTRALYPYMLRLEKDSLNEKSFIGGCIVNMSSIMGRISLQYAGNYPITKAGLNALSDVLRRELRLKKIRVSCIEPGAIDTNILSPTPITEDTEFTEYVHLSRQAWRKKIAKGGRLNPPSYIADLVIKCLFSYRNNGYDGIERLIGESKWPEYLLYTIVPNLPLSVADALLRASKTK